MICQGKLLYWDTGIYYTANAFAGPDKNFLKPAFTGK